MQRITYHTKKDELELFTPDVNNHVMGKSLEIYIKQRIHDGIAQGKWSEIFVRGVVRRPPSAMTTSWEKRNRPFAFQRPTTTKIDATTIQLNCFPSKSYVQHYASIVATFQDMVGWDAGIVRAIRPTESDLLGCLLGSNLPRLGPADAVIFGECSNLLSFANEDWPIPEGSERDLFVWQKLQTVKGKTVALLGCKESVWGETSGFIVRVLKRESNTKCVLYLGKAGALKDGLQPNQWIATGEESMIGTQNVSWNSALRNFVGLSSKVIAGKQVTVPSPLCETWDWLHDWQKTCMWVDCETGHVAQAANEVGIEFGYLSVVSDNLPSHYGTDLSNEDTQAVEFQRKVLCRDIDVILRSFLEKWDGKGTFA
jgi:hypothetical protein